MGRLNLRFVLLFGSTNFFSRRRRRIARYLTGSVLGVALSLVPLIVVMEVSDGMIKGITSRYLELGTYHLEAYLPENMDYSEIKDILSKIRDTEGVRNAFLEIRGLGLVYFKGKRDSLAIRAVSKNLYNADKGIRKYLEIKEGAFDLSKGNSILLSAPVADKLGVHVGDSVQLLALSGSLDNSIVPRISRMVVKGIFTTGYQDLDKLLVYIPFETGEKLLKKSSFSRLIGIKSVDPFGNIRATRNEISKYFPKGSYLYTWYQLEISQYKSFQTTKALLIFIMALIVLVASLNISSSMVMIVMENKREIAILKAIGSKPYMISLSFIITGLICGVAGTIVGLALGLFMSININEIFVIMQTFVDTLVGIINAMVWPLLKWKIESLQIFNTAYYLDRIPINIHLQELVLVSLFTTGLSVVASYFPAKKAAFFNPIELINRY